jgi:hypothetical protein
MKMCLCQKSTISVCPDSPVNMVDQNIWPIVCAFSGQSMDMKIFIILVDFLLEKLFNQMLTVLFNIFQASD